MSLFYRLSQQLQTTAAWRWYAGREPHERPVIAGLALLVVAVLFWVVIWKPISDWRMVETNRYENARGTWEWMQANESRARSRAAQSGSAASSERSLMPLLTREANALGIRLNRVQPEADGAVSVVVQAQPFNTLLQWLDRLASAHNIDVERISVDAEGQPGMVNAQIRLN
ncbi:MAG TPA: type II secretion system protein M [Pseudomonadales bacterium]